MTTHFSNAKGPAPGAIPLDRRADVPDEINPDHLFSGKATELLARIVRGELDARALAAAALAGRGFDLAGKFVGHIQSQRIMREALRADPTPKREIMHHGVRWVATGKIGRDMNTHEMSAEYEYRGTRGTMRLWADFAGNVTEENA